VSPEPLRRPSEPGGQLPAVEFREWTDPVYRIQDDDRISSRRYPKPRYRFDAPGGEYAVLYAKDTKVATFNESYAEKRRHGVYPRFRGSIERSRRGGTEIVGEYCPSGLLVPSSSLAIVVRGTPLAFDSSFTVRERSLLILSRLPSFLSIVHLPFATASCDRLDDVSRR
jgi:hypothetical protein